MNTQIQPGIIQELRVAVTTDIHSLSISIEKNIGENKQVYLACIGIPSIALGVKAVALINNKSNINGYVLITLPQFDVVHLHHFTTGEPITRHVLKMRVYRHRLGDPFPGVS